MFIQDLMRELFTFAIQDSYLTHCRSKLPSGEINQALNDKKIGMAEELLKQLNAVDCNGKNLSDYIQQLLTLIADHQVNLKEAIDQFNTTHQTSITRNGGNYEQLLNQLPIVIRSLVKELQLEFFEKIAQKELIEIEGDHYYKYLHLLLKYKFQRELFHVAGKDNSIYKQKIEVLEDKAQLLNQLHKHRDQLGADQKLYLSLFKEVIENLITVTNNIQNGSSCEINSSSTSPSSGWDFGVLTFFKNAAESMFWGRSKLSTMLDQFHTELTQALAELDLQQAKLE